MVNIIELKSKYLEMFPEEALSLEEISDIERKLGVVIPNDFREIASFFSGGGMGIIEFYDFKSDNAINIINETLRMREEINLPKHYVVLAEPPESLIVMDTKDKPTIIWCDSIDAENLDCKKFSTQPDVWESFSEFFYEMLLEEIE